MGSFTPLAVDMLRIFEKERWWCGWPSICLRLHCCYQGCHTWHQWPQLLCVAVQANSSAFSAIYSSTQLQNVTYDNSNRSDVHTYTYASEFSQARPSSWSHGIGLDAYSGSNVTAGVPQLLTHNDSDAPQGCVLQESSAAVPHLCRAVQHNEPCVTPCYTISIE